MIPQREDDSDPLQVWKRSLPEDEQPPTEDQVIHGKMFSKILAYFFGVLFSVTAWVYAGRLWVIVKQWFGL